MNTSPLRDSSRVRVTVASLFALTATFSVGAAPSLAQYNRNYSDGPVGHLMGTPETISQTASGSYLVPDVADGVIWSVPAAGGQASVFATAGTTPSGGVFLPNTAAWGSAAGQYLLTDQAGALLTLNSSGTVTQTLTDPGEDIFTTPILGTSALFSNDLIVTSQFADNTATGLGSVFIYNSSLAVLSDFLAPTGFDPFGAVITPSGFGAFGNSLLVSDTISGNIYSMDASGNYTLFTTVADYENVPAGQFGLRQMGFTPAGYLSSIGLNGQYLLVSVSGSSNGGGALGSLIALDSSGNVVAHLIAGSGVQAFDPRGFFFAANGLLISDASDPVGIVPNGTGFALGPPSVAPEPGAFSLAVCGLLSTGLLARRRRKS